jgi:hypothetical protein
MGCNGHYDGDVKLRIIDIMAIIFVLFVIFGMIFSVYESQKTDLKRCRECIEPLRLNYVIDNNFKDNSEVVEINNYFKKYRIDNIYVTTRNDSVISLWRK